MAKPRLLDLFSGAGGSARGYQLAGFHVTGVDIVDQPRYAGDEFYQADALEWTERMMTFSFKAFDAIHASPPCQHYANVTRWRGVQADHPDLIGPTRTLLEATGLPWVMENVRTKALRDPFVLCGSMFELRVIRHRYFESNMKFPFLMPACDHGGAYPFMHKHERRYADAMGCEWMNSIEARQAVPPAYTEWIGTRLFEQLATSEEGRDEHVEGIAG